MKSSKKTARTSELNKPYPFLKSISCCIVFHNMKGKHLRIADIVLIAFIFAASVSMLLFSSSGASYVQIETPDGIFRYTLSENRTIEAEGETSQQDCRKHGSGYRRRSRCGNVLKSHTLQH